MANYDTENDFTSQNMRHLGYKLWTTTTQHQLPATQEDPKHLNLSPAIITGQKCTTISTALYATAIHANVQERQDKYALKSLNLFLFQIAHEKMSPWTIS